MSVCLELYGDVLLPKRALYVGPFKGKIPCIIVPQIERFAFDVWDFAESAKALTEHNCRFASVDDHIDDSTVGMNLLAMMLNLADYYADQRAAASAPAEH